MTPPILFFCRNRSVCSFAEILRVQEAAVLWFVRRTNSVIRDVTSHDAIAYSGRKREMGRGIGKYDEFFVGDLLKDGKHDEVEERKQQAEPNTRL